MILDMLTEESIRRYLPNTLGIEKLLVYPEIASTNLPVTKAASDGEKEGFLVASEMQTAGVGRRGHTFFSPNATGLYFSILLRPERFFPEDAARITARAAVSLSRAALAVSGKLPLIKWVNDLFWNERKIAGILTRGISDESGALRAVILGVGVNLYPPEKGFPQELSCIAGALCEEKIENGRARLLSAFLSDFLPSYRENLPFLDEYRRLSFLLGKAVSFSSTDGIKEGIALSIDEECRLKVALDDGKTAVLSSGEVSVKPC